MSAVIRQEENRLFFGDHKLPEKTKEKDFSFDGGSFSVKTYKDITKLERNEQFVYESVPGTTVSDFEMTGEKVSFAVEGADDAEITLGLLPETEYRISVSGRDSGTMKTNLGGKLTLSVDFGEGKKVLVLAEKA